MRILAVQPGSSVATADVFMGLVPALERQGHELIPYQLDARIETAGSWLLHQWRRMGRPKDNKPTSADVIYQASVGVLERALYWMPDLVLIFCGGLLHPNVAIMLKRAGFRLGAVLTESPYDDEEQARFLALSEADIAWTNERTSVGRLWQACPHTFYLPHAYDPAKHYPREKVAAFASHDVVFVGTGFPERAELIRQVDWTGIDLGLYGTWDKRTLGKAARYVMGGNILRDATVQLYANAKIGLNLYRQSYGPTPMRSDAPRIEHAESLNPRAYELAACGVFQISDWRQEVDDVFGPVAPVTFTSNTEAHTDADVLGARIRQYLREHALRETKTELMRRAVQRHTFDARAAQMTADMQRVLGPKEALAA